MSDPITRDDWLTALADVQTPVVDEQDSLTAVEFAQLYQMSRVTADRRIATLIAQGRLRTTYKRMRLSDGRHRLIRSYALTQKGGSDAQRPPQRRRDLRRSRYT